MNSFLEIIQVQNFRNLSSDPISFGSRINCIFGDNGNGKTNLLEAIYYLIKKKSFKKNTKILEIVGIGSEQSEIRYSAVVRDKDQNRNFTSAIFKFDSYELLYNKQKVTKVPINVVFINPFDSLQFFLNKSFQRDFFDDLLSTLSTSYKKQLSEYYKTLKFRNILLTERPIKFFEQIQALDKVFALKIFELEQEKNILINEISDKIPAAYSKLFSEKFNCSLVLKSEMALISVEKILKKLEESYEKDVQRGVSTVGAHRDYFEIQVNGLNAHQYCSLGQQKTIFLSLLFAYIELFRYKYNTFPLVLIDDVSGELDSTRWSNLMTYLEEGNFQIILTTANQSFLNEVSKLRNANLYKISDGCIEVIR